MLALHLPILLHGLLCQAVPLSATSPAQPTHAFETINGAPLKIFVGDGLSFQVINKDISNTKGQIFPSGCHRPADMGILLRTPTTLYVPPFGDYGGTSCSPAATAFLSPTTTWTSVSISTVSGSGTTADPYTVLVTCTAPTDGLQVVATVTYMDGRDYFNINLAVSNTSVTAPITYDLFLGADIYLKEEDTGTPYSEPAVLGVGGTTCTASTYHIGLYPNPTTPADRWSARVYSTVWTEIDAGSLSNVVDTGCIDNGAAVQWAARTLAPGAAASYRSAVSFGDPPSCEDPCAMLKGPIPPPLYPNAFTPNGDGLNDLWCVYWLFFTSSYKFYIFDGGGGVIYHRTDAPYYGFSGDFVCMWDGRSDNGNLLPVGVYNFRLDQANCTYTRTTYGSITIAP